jgi:hypothetical protein
MEEKSRAKHSVLPKTLVVKGKREEANVITHEGNNGSKTFGSPEDFGRERQKRRRRIRRKMRRNTGAKHSVLPKTLTDASNKNDGE